MLSLPDAMVEDIRRGRVVLLLRSGASIGAKNAVGQGPPDGWKLRDALADRFLGGRYKDTALAWVAELAISETDLATVQDFVAELFRGMQLGAQYRRSLRPTKSRRTQHVRSRQRSS
jgi:hypothetical protein